MAEIRWLSRDGWKEVGFRRELQNILTTESVTSCKNILIMPNGIIAARTQENLKKLHTYIRRIFKRKNIFDRRTKAYRYLRLHDSEVL